MEEMGRFGDVFVGKMDGDSLVADAVLSTIGAAANDVDVSVGCSGFFTATTGPPNKSNDCPMTRCLLRAASCIAITGACGGAAVAALEAGAPLPLALLVALLLVVLLVFVEVDPPPKMSMDCLPPGTERTREVERVTKPFWLSFMVVLLVDR